MAETQHLLAETQVINNEIKTDIASTLRRTYQNDINKSLRDRNRCRDIAHIFETSSQFITVGATVFAFSAGFYDNKLLSFISGCLGSLSLAFLKTATFAMNESKERTIFLNQILKKMKIDTIPEITEDV